MTDDRDPTLTAARHLRRIVELAGMLEDQAVARSNHHDMPGGPAMVMLAPVASPQAWEFRIEAIEQRWWDDDTTGPEQRPYPLADEDGLEPPLMTLLLWSEALRYEHGAVLDVAPTIESEASWLTASLTWMWDHEPHFDEFERDLGRAVARMEAVLYAGERDERSQVPCIDCTLDKDGAAISVKLVRHVNTNGRADEWQCPKCRRTYDQAAFLRARHDHLASAGAERFVRLADAVAVIPKPESTIRSWLVRAYVETDRLTKVERLVQRGTVRWMCDIETRQIMAWWPDLREKSTASQTRRVAAAVEITAV